MTEDQTERLIKVLERIATRLENTGLQPLVPMWPQPAHPDLQRPVSNPAITD